MATSVTMPQLGESVSEGTVTRWLKSEGDTVEADEPLLEVSTDKVDTEIPSPAAGVLQKIVVGEDETVEVGVELATIGDGGEDAGGGGEADEAPAEEPEPEPEPETAQAEPEPEPEQQDEGAQAAASPADDDGGQEEPAPDAQPDRSAVSSSAAPSSGGSSGGGSSSGGSGQADGGQYATPIVRKLAAEHGVDLSQVQGSGVGGRIRKADVLEAAGQSGGGEQPSSPQPTGQPERQRDTASSEGDERIPVPGRGTATADQAVKASARTEVRGSTQKLSRLRSVIAERMTESLQVSAQLTTVLEADVTGIARLRSAAKADFAEREGVALSFLPFFAVATVEALRAHPVVNASIDQDAGEVTYHDQVNLGVAVDTERGLLVPVVKDAQDVNLAGFARKIADLAERTRSNRVTPDELGGGTFTLTNTGSRGALFDTPILNQPQVGILGTGAVVKRPVVVDDPDLGEVVAVRHMAYLALTYDHRLVDGADAARFLTAVKERLEGAEFEAELGL